MKEDLLDNLPEYKIYTTKTIILSSFFGGVLVSGYMLYKNFKSFGEQKKAKITIIVTGLILIAIFATLFVPILDNIPNLVYSFVVTIITVAVTKTHQDSLITKHINEDGKTYSAGRAVLICVISIMLVLSIILGIYFLQDAAVGNL